MKALPGEYMKLLAPGSQQSVSSVMPWLVMVVECYFCYRIAPRMVVFWRWDEVEVFSQIEVIFKLNLPYLIPLDILSTSR